jgi:putative transposase
MAIPFQPHFTCSVIESSRRSAPYAGASILPAMSHPRFLAPASFSHAIYHCVSRVVDRGKVLGPAEKEQFLNYMRLYEQLFGLHVLTFCLMDNHFHILVNVPRRPEVLPTNEELILRVRETLGEARADNLSNWLSVWEGQNNQQAIAEERERWFAQMWNLAAFMKVLKQRFSQWYNGSRPTRRTGTLWESRYRSVLVEDGEALRTIAAYIDLNPIRAGLVKDPMEYRWSGYGEACRGLVASCAGLRWMESQSHPDPTHGQNTDETPLDQVLGWYREQMYGQGEEVRDAEGKLVRRGFTEEEIKAVRDAGGRVPKQLFLRMRVRYFTDAAVLGTQAFVESVFAAHRERFSKSRRTGSRRMLKLELASPLRVVRALAVSAVT